MPRRSENHFPYLVALLGVIVAVIVSGSVWWMYFRPGLHDENPVVISVDNFDGVLDVYVDGVIVGQAPSDSPIEMTLKRGTHHLKITEAGSKSDVYLSGDIDVPSVWSELHDAYGRVKFDVFVSTTGESTIDRQVQGLE